MRHTSEAVDSAHWPGCSAE